MTVQGTAYEQVKDTKGNHIGRTSMENLLFTEIIISDSGTGIAKEDLPHIFDRFYKSKTAGNKNFGIGLSLARMIITNQNGVIKAENNAMKGALFTIRFYKEYSYGNIKS